MKGLKSEHVWWCYLDGAEVCCSENERPCCPKNPEHPRLVSIGWRVGFNPRTYSWYSTPEHAATDKRLKEGR